MNKRFLILFVVIVSIILISVFALVTCNPSTTLDTQMKDNTMDEEAITEEKTESYMDVTPEEAKKLINENPDLVIIDVSPDYDNGHLPGAVNYYVGDGSLDEAIPTLDPEGKYLVYCHVMSASVLGAQKLVDAGFKNVYRLAGEYSAWVDAGYPVEK